MPRSRVERRPKKTVISEGPLKLVALALVCVLSPIAGGGGALAEARLAQASIPEPRPACAYCGAPYIGGRADHKPGCPYYREKRVAPTEPPAEAPQEAADPEESADFLLSMLFPVPMAVGVVSGALWHVQRLTGAPDGKPWVKSWGYYVTVGFPRGERGASGGFWARLGALPFLILYPATNAVKQAVVLVASVGRAPRSAPANPPKPPQAAPKPPAKPQATGDPVTIAYAFPNGGGYDTSWKGTGSPEDIVFRGKTILAKSTAGTYCSGFTFAVVMRAATERGLLGDKTAEEIRRFQREWFGATPESREKQCVVALQNLGIGCEVPLEGLQPGDFAQLWRAKSGHSVVVLEVIRREGKIVGLKYRSSQGSTGGVGDRTEYFSDSADEHGRKGTLDRERTYACRLSRP